MKILNSFLLGKCDAVEFMCNYMESNELYEYIQSLIPKDAIEDPNHEYWHKCIMRSGLECYNFDVRDMLYSHCGFGEREEDQREIFDTILALYLWVNPKQKYTKLHDDKVGFYIELEQDCFGGPEVSHLVKSIANECLAVKPKSARKKEAKSRIEKLFHIQGKMRPCWIQGPQWPMGSNSPMKFVTQKRTGDAVHYEFRDVDTGEIKIVRQLY